MLIPFAYNMLRRHPALMAMIHRTDTTAGAESGKPRSVQLTSPPLNDTFMIPLGLLMSDGFLGAEPNPTLTNALESSLWELYSHRQHYHASVSTLAKVFQEAFTRPSYAMEDFLDHTYSTVRLTFPLFSLS